MSAVDYLAICWQQTSNWVALQILYSLDHRPIHHHPIYHHSLQQHPPQHHHRLDRAGGNGTGRTAGTAMAVPVVEGERWRRLDS